MPIEINELIVRITVSTEGATPQPDWDAVLRRLKREVLERCREEIEAYQQKVTDR